MKNKRILTFFVILTFLVALFPNGIVQAGGGTWTSIGSTNYMVNALSAASTGTTLYAGGDFKTVSGVSASRVAKWDGTGWSRLGSGVNGRVRALILHRSTLYVAGDFTTAGNGVTVNHVAKWNGTSWGSMNGNGTNGDVYALAYSSGYLYVGGTFTRGGSTGVNNIGKVAGDGTLWTTLGAGLKGGPGVYALAFAPDGTTLYAGGKFTTADKVSANDIAKWNGSEWSALGTGMNGSVTALAVAPDGTLYAGGAFTSAGGVPAAHVAKWNGKTWSALTSGMNGNVSALVVTNTGTLYAGGAFTTAGGASALYVAMWNGAWSAIGSTGSSTNALLVDSNGNLYAGDSTDVLKH